MKKRLIAFGMLIVLVMAMSMTALATDGINGNEQKVLDKFTSIQNKYIDLVGKDKADANTNKGTIALQRYDFSEAACNDMIAVLDKIDAELSGAKTKKELQGHQDALNKIANVKTDNVDIKCTVDLYANGTVITLEPVPQPAPGQDVPAQENTAVVVTIGQGIINQTGVDTTATVAVAGGIALVSLLGVVAFFVSRSKKVAR